jgi:hypothetical protein
VLPFTGRLVGAKKSGDPTAAAHLPVVMTNLPVALLSATSIVPATRAFRDWMWTDLAAKHSAPVVFLSVALIGFGLTFWRPLTGTGDVRWRRLLKIGAVLTGALTILWEFTSFDTQRRALGRFLSIAHSATRIRDVNTPFYIPLLWE